MWRWKSGRRRSQLAALLAIADGARDRRDWSGAAPAFAHLLALDPGNGPIWIQYGHVLKELGSIAEAERAYARAVALLPNDADAHLQHGHALKLVGKREQAIAALAEALRVDPGCSAAYDELLRLGERDRAGESGARAMRTRAFAKIEVASRRTAEAMAQAARFAAYPRRSYDEFRRDFPIAPPPGGLPAHGGEALFLIDAHGAVPALLRSTLLSLIDQADAHWRAVVMGSPEIAAHPVGSFAYVEPRIAFVTASDAVAQIGSAAAVVVLTAGTILDPQALSWMRYAAGTGAVAVYSDHDHGREEWYDGIERSAPAFYWAYDPEFFAATADVPAVVLACGSLLSSMNIAVFLATHGGESLRRAILLGAGAHGPAAHVPRLLATRLTLPTITQEGVADPPMPALRAWRPPPATPLADASIQVVIPTRDEAAMLERCVATLHDRSARPDRLRISIVDNRSTEEATRRILAEGVAAGRFTIRTFDEPFNWSRANNLAAAGSDAEILLFLNNDTEMLTQGWDDRLRDRLGAPDVGAVGARLLYADGAVQHAGILFGRQDGLPIHEALGAAGDEPGPLGRWITPRRVTAVTGACLAMRRSVFDQIGGFDERRLFVAYNDVDLCLRLREAGLAIVYDPLIEAIHHESRSRGHAVTAAQIAWDHAERDTLRRIWGEAMQHDPSYNPHLPIHGVPFDGLREPTTSQIVDHIRRSAEPFPWRATRAGPPADAGSVPVDPRSDLEDRGPEAAP